MSRSLVFWLLGAALAGPAAAQAQSSPITVRDAAVRAVAAGAPNTAGYMTIVNSGAKADKLLSVSCACARSVEVHISHVMNGMSMMMPSGPVVIPAGGSVAFAPGARHLMIMGLKGELKDGSSQELTLKFQSAGAVPVSFAVKSRIP
jgi:copper(I)-binding protein